MSRTMSATFSLYPVAPVGDDVDRVPIGSKAWRFAWSPIIGPSGILIAELAVHMLHGYQWRTGMEVDTDQFARAVGLRAPSLAHGVERLVMFNVASASLNECGHVNQIWIAPSMPLPAVTKRERWPQLTAELVAERLAEHAAAAGKFAEVPG